MAVPNVMVMETVRGFYDGYYRDIVTTPLAIREGHAFLDATPGLGARLRPELLARPDLQRRVSSAA
jgi:hypothetical protein